MSFVPFWSLKNLKCNSIVISFIFRSYIVYATNKMLKHSTFEKPKMQFSNLQQEYYSFNTILRITSRFRCLYNVHGKNWLVTLVQLITYNGGDTNNNAVTGSLSIVLVDEPCGTKVIRVYIL